MLFCIKESLCEPIFIRYTLKYLIPYGKAAKPREKIARFLNSFLELLRKIVFS